MASYAVAGLEWWFNAEQAREIKLERTQVVTGRLLDSGGPRPGVRIQALGLPGVETETDGQGVFVLDHLPAVPVTDLTVRGQDLVASTQGRAFYVLDDFSVLSHLTPEVYEAPIALLKPSDGIMGGGAHKIAFVVNEVSREVIGRSYFYRIIKAEELV